MLMVERPMDDTRAAYERIVAGIESEEDERRHASYNALQRNKRSIALNLKEPEAQEIFRQLASDTDVVVEGFPAGSCRPPRRRVRASQGPQSQGRILLGVRLWPDRPICPDGRARHKLHFFCRGPGADRRLTRRQAHHSPEPDCGLRPGEASVEQ